MSFMAGGVSDTSFLCESQLQLKLSTVVLGEVGVRLLTIDNTLNFGRVAVCKANSFIRKSQFQLCLG